MGKNINLKELFDLSKAEKWYKTNQRLLEKCLLPVVVALAVIVFWIFGGEDSADSEQELTNHQADTESALSIEMEDAEISAGKIYVDIGGDIVSPGVYCVDSGTRLFQVIELAGGLKETAAMDTLNQAEPVSDGQKIIIGSLDENSPYYIMDTVSGGNRTDNPSAGSTAVTMTEDGAVVNVNLATLEDLQLLPGVGPSTAQKILNYRQEHGKFKKPEDLKNISGIGEKIYENLKDFIET